MTYCVAMRLEDGVLFASDTRTNAGIDHVSTFKKMYKFGVDGERCIVILTSGNLATSQAVLSRLYRGLDSLTEPNLHNVSCLFDAAMLVGGYVSEIAKITQLRAHTQEGFGSSFLLGGQIKGQEPELYQIYPEGNCIRATTDTPFFQIGESKYGKPILDRSLSYDSNLDDALLAMLVSFDSTIRSNLSVDFPIDIAVYRNDSLVVPQGVRMDEHDPYLASIRRQWSEGLKGILKSLDEPPESFYL